LSYTTFTYSNLEVSSSVTPGQPVSISVDVTNTGSVAGEEVVQLYIRDVESSSPVPLRSLQGFRRIYLEPGQSKTVRFLVTARQLSLINGQNKRVLEPGVFEISAGGKQPGFNGTADAHTTGVVLGTFNVTGKTIEMKSP